MYALCYRRYALCNRRLPGLRISTPDIICNKEQQMVNEFSAFICTQSDREPFCTSKIKLHQDKRQPGPLTTWPSYTALTVWEMQLLPQKKFVQDHKKITAILARCKVAQNWRWASVWFCSNKNNVTWLLLLLNEAKKMKWKNWPLMC